MHLILTGASGLVGSCVLSAMLRNPAVTKISILTRKPLPQSSAPHASSPPWTEMPSKCNTIIHPDFALPPSRDVLAQLRGAQGCVWAQGTSITDVDRAAYEQITVAWPLAFARAFAENEETASTSPPAAASAPAFNFVYVSGEGATTSPGRFTPAFGAIKGRAEAALLSLSKEPQFRGRRLNVFSARPAGVVGTGQPEVQAVAGDRLTGVKRLLFPALGALVKAAYRDGYSPTTELGDILVGLSVGTRGGCGEGRTLANVALRALGKW